MTNIRPSLDETGRIVEYAYQLPRSVRPNLYAQGPFCRFELRGTATGAGVYAITSARALKYVGECEDLSDRFGPNGYGYIAKRNCHSDGQATNCKVNAFVLRCVKARRSVATRSARSPVALDEALWTPTPPGGVGHADRAWAYSVTRRSEALWRRQATA